MTAIDPLSGNATSGLSAALQSAMSAPTTSVAGTEDPAKDKDTFLKLLVAQLKYQDPSSPVDSTQFIAQTAQFTMVERLSEIQQQVQAAASSNQILEAASMIGKSVGIATEGGAPTATTVARVGGNLSADAAVGTVVSTSTTVYTTKGTPVPIKVEYTKLADGADGSKHWQVRTYLSTTQLSGPANVDFDSHGERTSPDVSITAKQLEAVPGTTGQWDANGLRLDMGGATDPARLRVASGVSTLNVVDQNGTDGQSLAGVVTAVRFTSSGPLLSVGGKEYPLSQVTGVHMTG